MIGHWTSIVVPFLDLRLRRLPATDFLEHSVDSGQMFERPDSSDTAHPQRSTLSWLSAAFVLLGTYFLVATDHQSWSLLCLIASGVLLPIDRRAETTKPNIHTFRPKSFANSQVKSEKVRAKTQGKREPLPVPSLPDPAGDTIAAASMHDVRRNSDRLRFCSIECYTDAHK
jgi:hypothetical protein